MFVSRLAVAVVASVPFAIAQCPGPGAVEIGAPFPQDSISGPLSIGFAFELVSGSTFTDIHVSDHGICFLSNGGTPPPPPAVPLVWNPAGASLVVNGPVIAVHWSDTIPGANGKILIDTSTAGVCKITWSDIISFGFPANEMSFELVLSDNPSGPDSMTLVYGSTVSNRSVFGGASEYGVVGVSTGSPATLNGAVDFSAGSASSGSDPILFEEWLVPLSFDMAGDALGITANATGGFDATFLPGMGDQFCASCVSYGSGCEGLVLSCDNSPILQLTWSLTTTGIHNSSPLTATFFSFFRQVPPTPLTSLGFAAPGCEVLVSPLLPTTVIGVVTGSSSTVVLDVGNGPFTGLTYTAQSVAFTDANSGGIAVSNAVEGRLGH